MWSRTSSCWQCLISWNKTRHRLVCVRPRIEGFPSASPCYHILCCAFLCGRYRQVSHGTPLSLPTATPSKSQLDISSALVFILEPGPDCSSQRFRNRGGCPTEIWLPGNFHAGSHSPGVIICLRNLRPRKHQMALDERAARRRLPSQRIKCRATANEDYGSKNDRLENDTMSSESVYDSVVREDCIVFRY